MSMGQSHILTLPQLPDVGIVIGGIRWTALIGTNLHVKAQQVSQKTKATHYVLHSAAVGTVVLDKQPAQSKALRYYSAAAIFAQNHPSGANVSQLELGSGDVWVVGAQDGTVDASTDVICTPEEAGELIAAFREKHPSARVVDVDFDLQPSIAANVELIPTKTAWGKIPAPAKVMFVALIGFMAISEGWAYWKRYAASQARPANVQAFDAKAEWAKTLNEWSRTISVDGTPGLLSLYENIGAVPLNVNGWALREMTCVPMRASWVCQASFIRQLNSSYQQFVAGVPEGWTPKWSSLTDVSATWTLPSSRKHLERTEVPASAALEGVFFSQLQEVFPAWSRIEVPPSAKIPINPPVVIQKDANGNLRNVQVPYPADHDGIELPRQVALTMTGPLRSVLLLPLPSQTTVASFKVQVDQRGVLPTIHDSMFTATIQGVTYVY